MLQLVNNKHLMKTIWKFSLSIERSLQNIEMPKGSEILCAQKQKDGISLWALVDSEVTDMENRRIYLVATGKPAPSGLLSYISTIQLYQDTLVIHVFEEILC